jgi:hypothetical protein
MLEKAPGPDLPRTHCDAVRAAGVTARSSPHRSFGSDQLAADKTDPAAASPAVERSAGAGGWGRASSRSGTRSRPVTAPPGGRDGARRVGLDPRQRRCDGAVAPPAAEDVPLTTGRAEVRVRCATSAYARAVTAMPSAGMCGAAPSRITMAPQAARARTHSVAGGGCRRLAPDRASIAQCAGRRAHDDAVPDGGGTPPRTAALPGRRTGGPRGPCRGRRRRVASTARGREGRHGWRTGSHTSPIDATHQDPRHHPSTLTFGQEPGGRCPTNGGAPAGFRRYWLLVALIAPVAGVR